MLFSEMRTAALSDQWRAAWPDALAVWNPYVKLREPTLCSTEFQAKREGLAGSFAMIRLSDHRIVIDLDAVQQEHVEQYALQILAHEIGHHVLIPANRSDSTAMMKRMHLALSGIENRAPLVSNLYSDLIINDTLHRQKGLDMASVYCTLQKDSREMSAVFRWYMRTYEYLWGMKRGELSGSVQSPQIDADASLTASLIRSYSRDWLRGAGRFACMAYPYLIEDRENEKAKADFARLLDALAPCDGSSIAGGSAEFDSSILDEIIDPRREALGKSGSEGKESDSSKRPGIFEGASRMGGEGPKKRYFAPGVYIDMMKRVNPSADENQLIMNYYRDIALPYLVPFPSEEALPAEDVLPEGTDQWEPGDPIEELDWIETALVSSVVIPGLTTRRRVYSREEDSGHDAKPYNLYVGIDCSGSMRNPKHNFSWPIAAGTIVALSALRAGARTMCCLSGEPGGFRETSGFVTSEKEVLSVLTDYLGSGYAYGIPRLESKPLKEMKDKTHLLIVSDHDIFAMLGAECGKEKSNWIIAEEALKRAGGGGTMVLHMHAEEKSADVLRLEKMGWCIYFVADETAMVSFAKEFAHRFYNKKGRRI